MFGEKEVVVKRMIAGTGAAIWCSHL